MERIKNLRFAPTIYVELKQDADVSIRRDGLHIGFSFWENHKDEIISIMKEKIKIYPDSRGFEILKTVSARRRQGWAPITITPEMAKRIKNDLQAWEYLYKIFNSEN